MFSEVMRQVADESEEESEEKGGHFMDKFLEFDPESMGNFTEMCRLVQKEALRFMSKSRFVKEFGCIGHEKRIGSVAKYFRWVPMDKNTLESKPICCKTNFQKIWMDLCYDVRFRPHYKS